MQWTAYYTDGTSLPQFDGEIENSYRSIDLYAALTSPSRMTTGSC